MDVETEIQINQLREDMALLSAVMAEAEICHNTAKELETRVAKIRQKTYGAQTWLRMKLDDIADKIVKLITDKK